MLTVNSNAEIIIALDPFYHIVIAVNLKKRLFSLEGCFPIIFIIVRIPLSFRTDFSLS